MVGCGDDDDDTGSGDGDADADGDGDGDADGDGDGDADADGDGDGDADGDGDGDVTFTGRVLAEEVKGVSAPLEGVEVELLDDAGVSLASDETDAAGEYSLVAREADLAFIHAHPVEGYAGQLREQRLREGLRFYDLTLQSDAGLETVHAAVGLTPDVDLATVVVGFNPVDPDLGGEGATLDPDSHEAPFVLVDDGAVSGNILPPICPNDGVVDCVDGDRGDFVFFPNVEPGAVAVELIQPDTGTCQLRFPIDAWLVVPHTSTIVEVDCLPN